ncbi:MAG: CPBP family intramembrane metalloprotease [Bacteroidetes bacterium]|nr:CPBP family intramembrane metalloprotease [Bacteroidota bacterium]
MAHIATKRYSYPMQLAILLVLAGLGFVVGGFAGFIPLLGKIDFSHLKGQSSESFLDLILKPEYANELRLMQFISTFFMFFVPAVLYSKICHNKPMQHLGFAKRPALPQLVLACIIIVFALFIVGALTELWKHIPFSPYWQQKFKAAEDAYNKQVQVMARMNGFGDFILSLAIVALLPAVFEEVIFRGALQNLLSRWTKRPILAVIITSVVFSAFHGSYDGFLPRAVLGFVLGWLFYRTGNLWISVAAHFFNNAIGITTLYFYSRQGKGADLEKLNDSYPIWLGIVGVIAVTMLLYVFDIISKKDIDRPGEEIPLPGYINPNNPFENNDDIHTEHHQNLL